MPATLSVVCMTHEQGPRLAAILGLLRPVAGEIIVAADSRMDVAELGEVAAVADRIVRFEFVFPAHANAWLHGLATGDWILLLDNDEVPSAALLQALPRLLRATDVQQYWIPRRWSFPDPHHWLDERPWAPDFQNRLVRNDATLAFSGRKHTYGEPVLPARYLEAPLYHLDCAVTTQAARERKVDAYEAARPGLQAPGGGALNERYYLPERFARRPVVAVSPEDRALIDRVIGARPTGAPAPEPAALEFVPRAEVERRWAGRDFGPAGFRAELTVLEGDPWFRPGETRPLAVRVANLGDERWEHVEGTEHPVRAAYRIRRPDGSAVVEEGVRTPFPADVAAGASTVLPIRVIAPHAPGWYLVEFDLVREGVRWFGAEAQTPILVAPTRPDAQDDERGALNPGRAAP